MAPVLVCVTVLLVAGLALWLANRAGNVPQHADLVQTVDLLVEEIAAHANEPTGLYDAREGFLRLGEQPHHHHSAALVGYAGESRHDSADSEQDGEPLPF
jgi:hypothetical protein